MGNKKACLTTRIPKKAIQSFPTSSTPERLATLGSNAPHKMKPETLQIATTPAAGSGIATRKSPGNRALTHFHARMMSLWLLVDPTQTVSDSSMTDGDQSEEPQRYIHPPGAYKGKYLGAYKDCEAL
jgi:hypothetical protein